MRLVEYWRCCGDCRKVGAWIESTNEARVTRGRIEEAARERGAKSSRDAALRRDSAMRRIKRDADMLQKRAT